MKESDFDKILLKINVQERSEKRISCDKKILNVIKILRAYVIRHT